MMQVEQIKAEIELLPQDKFIQLRKWFAEKDWGDGHRLIHPVVQR